MNLMIVDDEKLLRNGFKKMTDWQAKGVNIIAEATNGQDALDQLSRMNPLPDVIMTDIKMPLMDGVELTKQIKALYPAIEVIVLSAHDDYDYVRDSMKLGAYDYLLKASIDTDDIYTVLQRIKSQTDASHLLSRQASSPAKLDGAVYLDTKLIHNLIELHKFKEAKEYGISLLETASTLPTAYFQDIIRDLFFFIQYTLDTLGFSNNTLKETKYINSASINSLYSLEDATKWFDVIFDEFKDYYLSMDEKYTPAIQHIVAYIEEHYADNITLDDISEKFYINKNYLCTIFKSETNSTIVEYITTLRIEQAKKLIRTTNNNLLHISNSVGYNNYSYFGKVFRKKTGISPNEYANLYT